MPTLHEQRSVRIKGQKAFEITIADFKFTSQASHIDKLIKLRQDYEQRGFHLQRLYNNRAKKKDGSGYFSTFTRIMGKRSEDDY